MLVVLSAFFLCLSDFVFRATPKMKYCSTRGKVSGLSFEDVLFSGFLADGGMALPEDIPPVTKETLLSWAGLSYRDLVLKIVPMFVSEEEITFGELQST